MESLLNEIYKVIDSDMGTFEFREGQENLMIGIAMSMDGGYNLLAEAGVGIGKTLAYLIPGVINSKFTGRPLVVSTSSIQLTEQLVKDIKQVEYMLETYIKYIIGKGRTNYYCKQKLVEIDNEELLEYFETNINIDQQSVEEKYLDNWEKIAVNNCTYGTCIHNKECIFYDMRLELKRECEVLKKINYFDKIYIPRVIVVNHELLLANLLKEERGGHSLIHSSPSSIIIDEAHNLEKKTREFLLKEFSIGNIKKILSDLSSLLENGVSSSEKNEKIEKLAGYIEKIYNTLYNNIVNKEDFKLYDSSRITVDKGDIKTTEFLKIIRILDDLIFDIDLISTKKNGLNMKVEKISEKMSEILLLFTALNIDFVDKVVVWAEIRKKSNLFICYAPKNINEKLNKLLFNKGIPVIVMSATIAQPSDGTKGEYDYIAKNIGFQGEFEEVQHSPFPYDNNTRLIIPDNLPNYKKRDSIYFKIISEMISDTFKKINKRTLVLFTAKEDMIEVFERLKNEFDSPIYVDNGKMSQKLILENFKRTGGIILGSGVFWEGIDLPGELLVCLIIVRLPFPVRDPVIDYECSLVKDSNDVIFPRMLMTLKQGIGRLIRKKTDKGILVILDSRLNNKNYKNRNAILSAIPINKIVRTVDEAIKLGIV